MKQYIENYMKQYIKNYIITLSVNGDVQELLVETIGKILFKQSNLEKYIKENEDKIIHIRDWINSIVENNKQWKTPRVLTIEALNYAADKYFEKQNNKLKTIELDETHEKLIADLGDYYIVQMLTAQALDKESKVMQHCIGQGGYDKYLEIENYKYLSLRDKFNKAHVTLEITKDRIEQLRGKQNDVPEIKYLEKIVPWLIGKKYKNIPWNRIGKFYDNGQFIKLEDIKIKKDIDFEIEDYDEKIKIVKMLTEKSEVYFKNVFAEEYNKTQNYIDENLNIIKVNPINYFFIDREMYFVDYLNNLVKNDSYREMIEYLRTKNYNFEDLSKYSYIINENDNKVYSIYNMPENCVIRGDLNFGLLGIEKLPDNLTVYGILNLSHCKNIEKLPENLFARKLDLRYSGIKYIPDNMRCKEIHIEKSKTSLINKKIDFESISINFFEYTKEEFLEKYKGIIGRIKEKLCLNDDLPY